jgi:hypothetical protein
VGIALPQQVHEEFLGPLAFLMDAWQLELINTCSLASISRSRLSVTAVTAGADGCGYRQTTDSMACTAVTAGTIEYIKSRANPHTTQSGSRVRSYKFQFMIHRFSAVRTVTAVTYCGINNFAVTTPAADRGYGGYRAEHHAIQKSSLSF